MCIESQINDIQSHLTRLEELLEALSPKPMSLSAALAMSAGNKARMTHFTEGTIIVVWAVDKGGCIWVEIEDGEASNIGETQGIEAMENWIDKRFGYLGPTDKVWFPV